MTILKRNLSRTEILRRIMKLQDKMKILKNAAEKNLISTAIIEIDKIQDELKEIVEKI